MPNKIWEKATVLPTGGQQQSFIRPNGVADEDLKLQNPLTPTLGNMSNVNPTGASSMLQQPQQSMLNTTPANFFASPQPAAQPSVSPLQVTQPEQPVYSNNTGDPTQSVLNFLSRPSVDEIKSNRENESKKRLLLIADALRHIGNIYNTTQGATPQQFSSPVVEQEARYQQEKQRQQRQRSMALEQALAVAKQRADENYKNSTLALNAAELQYKQDEAKRQGEWQRQMYDRNQEWKKQQFESNQKWKQMNYQLSEKRLANAIKHNRTMESIAYMNAATSRTRANNGGSKSSKDKLILRSSNPEKNMYLDKSYLNDPSFQADTKRTYDIMVANNIIKPVQSRRWDANGGEKGDGGYVYENKHNPTVAEMLKQMDDGAYSWAYMTWANRYVDNPLKLTNTSLQNRQAKAKQKAAGTNSWRTNSTKR